MAYSSDFVNEVLSKNKKKKEDDYITQVLNGTYKPKDFTKPKVTFGTNEKQPTRATLPTVSEATSNFKKEEDKPWYQEFLKSSAAFKDGYDFGDVTKTVGSSAADAVLNVGGGILGVVEGVTDLATYGTGEILDLVGADNAAEKVKAAGKKSWVDSLLDKPKHYMNQNSIFGDTSDKVFQGVGTTLGFMAGGAAVGGASKVLGAGAKALSATGKATKVANVLDKTSKAIQTGNLALKIGKTGKQIQVPLAVLASASGSGISEAYSKGDVSDWKAWTSGIGSGSIEALAEGMFGMFGIGGSSLDDALTGRAMSAFKSGFGKGMAKVGVQAAGEGVEEMVSYFGNFMLNNGVDLAAQLVGDDSADLAEKWNSADFWENFVVGAASAALMGGMSSGVEISKAQDNAIKVAETELGRKLTAEEKKSIKEQTSLQLMQNEEAEMLNKKSESEQKLVDNYVNAKTTELTKQKAIESELEKAIKTREAEQGGTLTARNKEALKQSITAKIESGEIDISGTKLDNKDLKKIQAEVESNLEAGKYDLAELEDVLTPEKTAQLKELEAQLSKTKSETKKAELQDQINNLVASKTTDLQGMLGENKYLNKAVYESLQATKSYKYEESQVKTKGNFAKSVYESASTHANNATEIRNFVENVARLAEDRQTSYRFTNNAELKEQGDLLEKEKLKPHEIAKLKELEAKLSKARTEADKKKLQEQIDEIKYYDIGGFVRKNVDGVETVLINIDSKQSLTAVVGHETKHLLEKNGLNKDFNKLLFEYAKSKGDYDTYKERIEKLYEGKGDVESELAAALTGDYLFTDSKFVETLLNSENKTLIQKIKDLIKDLIVIFKGTPQEKQLRKLQSKFKELYKQQAAQTVSATQETNTQYSIQGLEDYTEDEIKSYASDYIQEKLEENDIYDVTIKGMAINGSRGRGTARTDSDLDIVVEYEGDIREDDMFEILNEEQLEIDGISVDINPITATRSGTLEEYMKRSKAYDKKVLSGSETKYSLTDNQGRELTKEQQEHFKDSKVRDENGNLLTMYHGTTENFNVFDKNKIRATDYDATFNGFWFSNKPNTSPAFSKATNTKEVYLDIKNPAPFDVYQAVHKKIGNELGNGEKAIRDEARSDHDEVRYRLQDMGYDGVHWESQPNIDWAAFEKDGQYTYQTVRGHYYTIVNNDGYIDLYTGKTANQANFLVDYESVESFKELHNDEVWVAFEPNQIKNVGNTNPTSNPDIRYSLSDKGTLQDSNGNEVTLKVSDTGTHGTLMAMHNLSEKKLKGILKLGGFPVPSIAIAKNVHEGYGEITVLFDKSTIDPAKKANEVYDRDVWSPRFPRTINKFASNVDDAAKNLGLQTYQLKNHLEGNTIEEAIERLSKEDTIVDKFLEDNGIQVEQVEDVYKSKEPMARYHKNSEVQDFIRENDVTYKKLMEDATLREKYLSVLKDWAREEYKDTPFKSKLVDGLPPFIVALEENLKKDAENGYYEGDLYVQNLSQDFANIKNPALELDEYATKRAQREAKDLKVKEHKQELDNYIREQLETINEGKYFEKEGVDPYTANGRKPFSQLYTKFSIDNLVKAMKSKRTIAGERNGSAGYGEINAAMAKKFKSIKDIKASENQIVSRDIETQIHETARDAISKNLFEISTAYKYYKSDADIFDSNNQHAFDNASDALFELASSKNITIENFRAILNENLIDSSKLSTDTLQKTIDNLIELGNLPTEYFEAKPQRAVGLDEIQAVVIPSYSSEELKQQLQEAGLKYYEYDDSVKGDKQRVINQFDDLKFSLSQQSQAISPIGDYNIYGRDMKVQSTEVQDESEATEVSESGNRTEADTTRAREEATRDISELKAELNTRTRDAIQNNLGLDNKAVDDIISKLNSKNTLTEQDIYDAFDGHREIVEPISDEMSQERRYVKAWLKDKKINVGKMYKSDINAGEFNDFRRRYFGKTNFVLNGGEAIDTAYMEMSHMFPHLFPEDIVHPADQAYQIAEVLDEMYGPKTQTYELTDSDLASIVNEIYGGYTVIENYRNIFMEKYGEDIFETPQNANTDTLDSEASNLPSNAENVSKRVKLSEIEPLRNNTSPVADEDIAEVMVDEPTTAKKKKDRKLSLLAASILDKGLVFENLSLKTKNRFLMAKWDYMLTSNARAQSVIGQGHYEYDPTTKTSKQVSKSLDDIRAEVANTGHVKEFYEFMYHNLNIDRMSLESRAQAKIRELKATLSNLTALQMQGENVTKQAEEIKEEIARLSQVRNKAVFGDKITAQLSQDRVNEYLEKYPEFADFAKDVYDYTRADRQQLVKGGVISQETADLWEEMYPHFIPIRRADKQGAAINVALDTGRTGVNAPVQRATGGNTDILPLFDTLAQRTMQTHRATAKNSFGIELKNTLDSTRTGEQATIDDIIDSIDTHEGLLQEGVNGSNPTFTVFENGERVTYEITQDMYDALKPVSDSSLLSKTSKILNTASSFHRGVLTQYNPVFMLTNAIKDVQDVLINSQHPFLTYKNIPEAFAQLKAKGYWYQEYMSNGGEQNSYFDSQDNTFDTERKGISKVLDLFPLKQIADMNDFVEMIPRLAEYIASREAGRSIEVSMLDAARVTTNFKAGGDLTKFLNRNGVTFLNASVQGAMQQARNVREANANGLKGWAMLATKFAVAGLPAVLLNSLIWGDDDEYEELSEYVKENYYIVGKYGDGNFIRIPKGRTVAVIQDALQQIVDVSTGNDEADLKGFLELMATNLAPNNPIENNILSPIVQVATNKTWYGEDLVPTRLQDLPSKEQYDESTDNFSKWLGEKTGISPVKINYLLDQYTGGVGDVILPMMTPEATSGTDSVVGNVLAPLTKKFTTNSTMNNQNVSDFYSTSEELTTEAKKADATDEDVLRNKYMNSVKAEMNELYAQKREIQNSSLPKSEKWKQVQAVQKQINELSKKGLNNYEDVKINGEHATVGEKQFRTGTDGEWTKITDKQQTKQESVSGALDISPSQYWNNKDEYDFAYEKPNKYKIAQVVGDYETYKTHIDTINDIKGSDRKDQIESYINNISGMNYGQKVILFKSQYKADDRYNSDIIDYLNSRDDISYNDMVAILKELGFTVKNNGRISW